MHRLTSTLCLALVLLCTTVATTHAQTPFKSAEGLAAATSAARDSIGSDATLIIVLGFGFDILTGGEGFNVETGESPQWIYQFFSPSRLKTYTHVITQPIPTVFLGEGGTADSADPALGAMAITASLPFSNSDQMASRIRSNGEYQIFREDNGRIAVDGVQLARGQGTPGFPDDFPSTDELWAFVAHAENDTTKQLVCVVASSTGQTICLTNEQLGIDEGAINISSSMDVVPNPAHGRTRVTITAPTSARGLDGIRVGLHNAAGEEVLDLTEAFARSGNEHAEFDASSLPAGLYFCRAVGAGYSGVIGTVVLGR